MTPPDLDWRARLGPVVTAWAESSIREMVTDQAHDYANSFRAARKGNGASIRRFKKCRTCCGKFEWFADFEGVSYLLGYNHGH